MDRHFKYQPQDWQKYDSKLNIDTNIELGGVATPERMEHIEEGLVHANKALSIEIIPADIEMTENSEKDDRRVLTVYTDKIEPLQRPITITIDPCNEDTTTITELENKTTKDILVKTSKLEPRWPENLEIVLEESTNDEDYTIVEDIKDDKLRRITIKSAFLNNVAIKPAERDLVLYRDRWVTGTDYPFEFNIGIEAEVTPSNIVRFTKGLNITSAQIVQLNKCKVKTVENLDGTFKAVAQTRPSIDIPLHVVIM